MNGLFKATTTKDNLVDAGVSKVDSELKVIRANEKESQHAAIRF
jgi:hypothetical protein